MSGPTAETPVRVVVADDHAGYREGLARLIDDHPGLVVVGIAADGVEALERIVDLGPDVALLDVRMPGHTGIEVCRRLQQAGQATRVLLITGTPDPVLSVQAGRAGAVDLIGKETSPAEICTRLLALGTRP